MRLAARDEIDSVRMSSTVMTVVSGGDLPALRRIMKSRRIELNGITKFLLLRELGASVSLQFDIRRLS